MSAQIEWPTPFHFEYGETTTHVVKNSACQITLVDGTQVTGKLRRFLPNEGIVEIKSEQMDAVSSIDMDTISGLSLLDPLYLKKQQDLDLEAHGEETFEPPAQQKFSVSFKDGKKLEGQTAGFVNETSGIYLFPVDKSSAVMRCFIPAASIDRLTIGKLIGQMLIDEEAVTREQVEAALERQNQLRSRRIGDYLTGEQFITAEQLPKALERQHGSFELKLGEALIQEKLISQAHLDEALGKQQSDRQKTLGEILVSMGIIERATIRRTLAKKLGIPFVNMQKFSTDHDVIKLVPDKLIDKYTLLPLFQTDKTMVVAMEDPMQSAPLEELRFLLNLNVEPVMALKEDLLDAIDLYHKSQSNLEAMHDLAASLTVVTKGDETTDDATAGSDNALVKLINLMIVDACNQGASDIHVESAPGKLPTRVRFRKDGVMVKYFNFPPQFKKSLVSRLKIMAQLDISEKRKSQDGTIEFRQGGNQHKIEIRVVTIPTAHGLEDIVMRVVTAAKPIPLKQLGLAPDYLETIKKLATSPYGLFLISGPTGSGKTTTLHSVLDQINTDDLKIWTVEDPIEITQEGLRQVQVNNKVGWTFAAAMRSFLRADPDVIMVGEMRDAETSKMVIEASLTGHLVFSTLHTNSAPECMVRLLDLGMDPFNFSDALLGVLAQRLVRRFCDKCKKAHRATKEEIFVLAEEYCSGTSLDPETIYQHWQETYLNGRNTFTLYTKTGCQECDGNGYTGRLGLHELLVATPKMKKLIQHHATVEEMQNLAITQGMRTIKQDGIEKVLQGHTDMHQVRSACAQQFAEGITALPVDEAS